jgi:hypothetical protein
LPQKERFQRLDEKVDSHLDLLPNQAKIYQKNEERVWKEVVYVEGDVLLGDQKFVTVKNM